MYLFPQYPLLISPWLATWSTNPHKWNLQTTCWNADKCSTKPRPRLVAAEDPTIHIVHLLLGPFPRRKGLSLALCWPRAPAAKPPGAGLLSGPPHRAERIYTTICLFFIAWRFCAVSMGCQSICSNVSTKRNFRIFQSWGILLLYAVFLPWNK